MSCILINLGRPAFWFVFYRFRQLYQDEIGKGALLFLRHLLQPLLECLRNADEDYVVLLHVNNI